MSFLSPPSPQSATWWRQSGEKKSWREKTDEAETPFFPDPRLRVPALGCVGIVLPVLPTVPFFLATCVLLCKLVGKAAHMVLGTELYQKHLDSFVKKKGMTAQTKAAS